MKRDADRQGMSSNWNGVLDVLDEDSRVRRGARVRIPWLTWEAVACLVVLVTLCVVFGDDEPVGDEGSIALSGSAGVVEMVRFSPDGENLAASCWDGTVKLWNVQRATRNPDQSTASLFGELETYSATFSPDGHAVAATGLQGLTVWNWRDPESLPEVRTLFAPCRAAVYAPDGRSLAAGGPDRRIHVWDSKLEREFFVLSGHRSSIRALSFTPDGLTLISLDFDGVLKFWDVQRRREVERFETPVEHVHTIRLSRDGGTLALSRLGASASRIEVWDLKTNTLRAVCPGHQGGVHALAFSPDNQTLVSVGGDRVLRFWNAETGGAAGPAACRVGWVRSIDVSSDGRWLAYSGAPNQVYLKSIDLAPRPH